VFFGTSRGRKEGGGLWLKNVTCFNGKKPYLRGTARRDFWLSICGGERVVEGDSATGWGEKHVGLSWTKPGCFCFLSGAQMLEAQGDRRLGPLVTAEFALWGTFETSQPGG